MAKCYVSWRARAGSQHAGTTAAGRSIYSIYTGYLHTTVAPDTGPDNTLPSHHSREGQSDAVRLRDIGQVNEPHFHNTANTMKIA